MSPKRVLLANGKAILALTEAWDPSQVIPADRFDENRVGLDHLSFRVGSRNKLEAAIRHFDEQFNPILVKKGKRK